jgi:hypothetical protein
MSDGNNHLRFLHKIDPVFSHFRHPYEVIKDSYCDHIHLQLSTRTKLSSFYEIQISSSLQKAVQHEWDLWKFVQWQFTYGYTWFSTDTSHIAWMISVQISVGDVHIMLQNCTFCDILCSESHNLLMVCVHVDMHMCCCESWHNESHALQALTFWNGEWNTTGPFSCIAFFSLVI